MICIRSTAIPAAVTLGLFVGGCQDAPMSPRLPTARAAANAPAILSPRIHVYSGQRADSVANEILSAWAINGHPEYLAQRRAFRAGLHLVPEVRSMSFTPGAAPTTILLDGGTSGGVYKDPARINGHAENFFFGQSDGTFNNPGLLNGSMIFLGDYGQIDARVTVTGKAGASVSPSATIAQGSGQFTNCVDVISSSCSSKFLEGVLTVDGAPTCDAHAEGSVTFTAQNRDQLNGVLYGPLSTSTAGFTSLPAVSIGPISVNSAACAPTGATAGTGGSGGGGDPGTPPSYPAPEPPPSISPPSAPVQFHCETAEWWFDGVLEGESTSCYPD